MYEVACSILRKINQLGYEAYIVGGYPRNRYMEIDSEDIDICTSMPIDAIVQTFVIQESYPQYGSFLIKENQFFYELTIYRKDYYGKNRYPSIVFVNTLKEDLQRRDFVMNTLCIDADGQYIDLLGAKDDIDKKIIRMVGNPDQRLQEDPLRIVRAIRFAADFDFELELNLMQSIVRNKSLLKTLSNARIQKELSKVHNMVKWNDWVEHLDLESYLP